MGMTRLKNNIRLSTYSPHEPLIPATLETVEMIISNSNVLYIETPYVLYTNDTHRHIRFSNALISSPGGDQIEFTLHAPVEDASSLLTLVYSLLLKT